MIAPDNIGIFSIILVYPHLEVVLEDFPDDGVFGVVHVDDELWMPRSNRLLLLRPGLGRRVLSRIEVAADSRCCSCSQLVRLLRDGCERVAAIKRYLTRDQCLAFFDLLFDLLEETWLFLLFLFLGIVFIFVPVFTDA